MGRGTVQSSSQEIGKMIFILTHLFTGYRSMYWGFLKSE